MATTMIATILEYLKTGKSITAYEAATMWGELNLRNKISDLRKRGWNILSEEIPSKKGGKFKRYYLDTANPGCEDE